MAGQAQQNSYFSDLYTPSAGGVYQKAIADIESFVQGLSENTMVTQALLNQHIMTLLSSYVQAKIKKQNEVMSEINKLNGSVKNKAKIKALRKEIKKYRRVAKREGESKPDGIIELQIDADLKKIDNLSGIAKKNTNELNADQTEYNQVSAEFDAPTQTLQATSQGFTTSTQTLAGDMKNQIQVIGALVQLASYLANKI